MDDLMSMLSTNNANTWETNSWIFDGIQRFLDKKPITTNKIGFSSFPGSCTSTLRYYLEQMTGVFTGSDASLHLSTS